MTETALHLQPGSGFVATEFIEELTARAKAYLEAGYAVHFQGPAGAGKTTMALHLAARIGRPVILIHGDEHLGFAELVGRQEGYRRRQVIDNFVHTVVKTSEDLDYRWVDGRLKIACERGCTLVYDEFTRSRPEANNTLLSVLEEGLLDLSGINRGKNYLQVHPDFKVIFTSNPEEYAGIYKSQDALRDRLITLELDHFDPETEVAITSLKSGLPPEAARAVVDLIREVRRALRSNSVPSLRRSIMIAKTLARQGGDNPWNGNLIKKVCADILGSDIRRVTEGPWSREEVVEFISISVAKTFGKRSN